MGLLLTGNLDEYAEYISLLSEAKPMDMYGAYDGDGGVDGGGGDVMVMLFD